MTDDRLTVVCQGIQCGAGASTIARLWRDIRRPLSFCPWGPSWGNMAFPPIERHDIDQRQYKVPRKGVESLKHSRDKRHKEHGDCEIGIERAKESLLFYTQVAEQKGVICHVPAGHPISSPYEVYRIINVIVVCLGRLLAG